LLLALTGGEEYELLVAMPAKFGEAEAREFARSFDLPLTRIGVLAEGTEVIVVHDGQPLDLGGGFSHF
ncbi:MAG: thiamine-phosphate kinase, partial [Gemmatimonadota bacterium]|nr:thiamine-phosphate kinase [Gemmatimonadota bacterium]